MYTIRTTLTVDDDLAAKLRKLARRRRVSFKEVVNSVLRSGLSRQEPSRRPAHEFSVPVFRSALRPGVDLLHLNKLSDELEVEHSTGRRE